jgi:hypothetical protein
MAKKENMTDLVLNAVGLAMGVAAVVLSLLGIGGQTNITLLGIGVFCLGLSGLEKL